MFLSKKILTTLILTSITVFVMLALYLTEETKRSVNNEEENLPAYPLKAIQFEIMRKSDPKTGKIPVDGRWKAYQQLKTQGKISHHSTKTTNEPIRMWKPVDDFFNTLSITKLTYEPNNTNIFYFCTGEGWFNADAVQGAGVWKSLDGGTIWNQLPATDTSIFYWCQDIAVHPVTGYIYVATQSDGLQRSKDGGTSWNKVLGSGYGSSKNTICDIEFTANGGIFATIGIFETDGMYYSESGDTGTWKKLTNGFPATDIYRIEMATALSNDSVAYAIPISTGADNYEIKGVYKTIDKGNTWVTVSDPGGKKQLSAAQGWYDLTIAVDPNNENVVVTGGLNLWKTIDGGNTWKQLTIGKDTVGIQYVHVDQHEIVFQSSDTVYFGNDGGIWKCDNFTDSIPFFYNRNFTYNVTQYYATAIHPEPGNYTIMGGTQDNGSAMSTGSGISDFHKLTGADGSFCAFNHKNGNVMFTTKQEKPMYRFSSGGFGKYDTITNPYIANSNTLFINPMEIDPFDPEIIYQASNRGLWRLSNASTADSNAWVKACKNIGIISAIGISKSKPNTVFLGKNNGGNIYRIDGANLTDENYTAINCDPKNLLPDAYASCIYVDPDNVNHLIVTFTNYGVQSIFESKNATDSIADWQLVEGDLPDIPVNWALLHPVNKTVCYIATDIGVLYTKQLNGNNTVWLPSINGLANVRTDMIRIRTSDYTVVAATHGRGLFTGKLDTAGTNYEITWTERGPANVGGRTRTIMVDPNDPTKTNVWAASVSGGLWKTSNIEFKEVYDIVLYTSSTDESFAGANDGSASVSVTGGTTPFSYFWSNGLTTSILSNVTAGSYTVTVTDINGLTKNTVAAVGLKSSIAVENFSFSLSSGNPFTENITLFYTVVTPSPISIKIYDIYGKLVGMPIQNETKNKGYYFTEWNSSFLDEGIYFVVMQNDEEQKVLKIIKLNKKI